MKQYSRIIIAVVIAALIVATFVFLWKKSQPKEVQYAEVQVEQGDISRTTVITGKIEPRDEVNIKPQISGIICELCKQAGDMVSEGDVIAKVKVIPDMGQLASAESRVRLADMNLRQAQTDYKREKALYDQRLVAAEEMDKQSQQLRQAKEELAAAEEALQVVRDGYTKAGAKQSSTLVRSTISGLILDIPVKVGNSVILANTMNDGTTIATVANMHDLIFRGNIDESEVGRLRQGMPMKITIGALQDMSFDASIEYIAPKATEVNGANQFEIKAAVDAKGKEIRSGYGANAQIILEGVKGVTMVRESTIEFSGDSAFVYLPKDKGYERRQVRTGMSDGVNIEITKGLRPGDKVRGAQVN